jgi:PAS domain S-box-containing protein
VLNRLGELDLLGRGHAAGRRRITPFVVAALLLIVGLPMRLLIDDFVPGVLPFALVFPAVLMATLAAGWASGVIVGALGGLYAWVFVMHHSAPFGVVRGPATVADLVNVGLSVLSAGAIIALADSYRINARRLAREQALRLAEREGSLADQRRLFEHARGFIAVVSGPDYVFDFANDAYRRLVGGQPLEGKTLLGAVPTFPRALVKVMDGVRATGVPYIGHAVAVPFRRGRGLGTEDRFLDFVLQPIVGADGAVDRIFFEGFDVTETMRSQAALKESEARLELAASSAGVGVIEWRLPTNEMIFSDRAKAICGFEADAPVTYEMVAASIHPDDHAAAAEQTARARDPDIRLVEPYEYRIVTPQGEERWVLASGQALFDEIDGVVTASRYIGTLQDITARKTSETEAAAWAARLRLAIDTSRMAIWQNDVAQGFAHSPELNKIFGLPEDARPTVAEVRSLYMPGELERVQANTRAAFVRGDRNIEVEYRIRRADGAVRWLLVRAEVVLDDEQKRARSVIGVSMDITERKDSEERMKLLAREVDHRANNLLAVIQGTVQLSRADTPEALKTVVLGRIAALGRAHQLLSEARWEGADLRRLVEEELLAFSLGEASRVSIRGPDVALSPPAAQALAMALHELATNAAKYGALSAPGGHVEVSWAKTENGPLSIVWSERGGPKVAPPSRRGLGTTILARALAGSLRGESKMDWRPTGLVCTLELPAKALETVDAGF